jgi:hypothetical protein
MPVNKRIALAGALCAILSCGTACSHGGTDAPGGHGSETSASSHSDRPTIHYDQTGVLVADGAPIEEKSYKSLLEGCQRSGSPTTPLTPDEVAKLGRVHTEAFIGPDKSSIHTESWEQAMPSPCHFTLTHKDNTEIADVSGHVTAIDAVARTADVQETGQDADVGPVPADDGQETDADRQAGWSKLAGEHANGTDCSAWRDARGAEVCVWSGGGRWGYSSSGVNAVHDGKSDGSTIILWAKPGQGASWKIDTHVFSVGEPLPQQPFEVPAGITVNKSSS